MIRTGCLRINLWIFIDCAIENLERAVDCIETNRGGDGRAANSQCVWWIASPETEFEQADFQVVNRAGFEKIVGIQ